jgi:hypothetical protein
MNPLRRFPGALVLCCSCALLAVAEPAVANDPKPRLFVLTDVSNEPDDEESLVRLLVYSIEYDLEGIVATTSTWLKDKPREDLIRRDVDAYGLVQANLAQHAPGYPTAGHLRSITAAGQPHYGMADVGEGKGSPGSALLLAAASREDARPLWVSIWGGANTLAQALRDLRATRPADEVQRTVARLRVYSISDQDDAGPWLRREFPELFYIVSPTRPDYLQYHLATWTGISGDREKKDGIDRHAELVANPWLEEHIIRNHGPLGALYPRLMYIMEGDTPSFLGLINNGLGWSTRPDYGGWGGRYVLYQPLGESRPIWTNNRNSQDTVATNNGYAETSDQATIWRWREAYQYDFAARMNWCIAPRYTDANHNPRAVLNGDHTKRVLTLSAKSQSNVALSAEGTEDPDHNELRIAWWIYPEAGTLKDASLTLSSGPSTEVHLPATKTPGTVHVILQVRDDGSPNLFAYRRAVIEVTP